MKVAYFLQLDITLYDGVAKKILSQVQEWSLQFKEVKIFCIVPDRSDIKKSSLYKYDNINWYFEKKKKMISIDLLKKYIGLKNIFDTVFQDIIDYSPDRLYYRWVMYTPFIDRLNKEFITITELNTDPKSEYALQKTQSIKYLLRYLYFKVVYKKSFRNINGLVGVTNEITNDYGREKKITIPNAINFSNFEYLNEKATNKKNLVFIGSPNMPWHGVDLIMKLASLMPDILFNIVGINDFEKATKNVKFHGFLTQKEYFNVFKESSVAIASLAMFRNNMDEACPLKVREYIAHGLPVIMSFNDTAFYKNEVEWILKIPNNEKGILDSVNQIRNFLSKINGKRVSREESSKYVNTSSIERKRIEFIRNII